MFTKEADPVFTKEADPVFPKRADPVFSKRADPGVSFRGLTPVALSLANRGQTFRVAGVSPSRELRQRSLNLTYNPTP